MLFEYIQNKKKLKNIDKHRRKNNFLLENKKNEWTTKETEKIS